MANVSKQTTSRAFTEYYTPYVLSYYHWLKAEEVQKKAESIRQQKEKELEEAKIYEEKIKKVAEQKRNIFDDWFKENILEEARLPTSSKADLVYKYRSLWQLIPHDDETRQIALAVVHGIVERTRMHQLVQEAEWILNVADKINSDQVVDPCQLEIEARFRGLSVLDQERDPETIRALFGVVSEIEEGEARLSMSIPEGRTDPTLPIWESYWVPIADLPEAYVVENVWVAWVERTYICDGVKSQKGRFEPASNSPKKVPQKTWEEVLADLSTE